MNINQSTTVASAEIPNLTVPKGFRFGTANAKVRNWNRQDVGVIVSDSPATAAATLTQNGFRAAPVQVTEAHLAAGAANSTRAIVVNAGCANAATGGAGLENARAMARDTAKALPGVTAEEILVCSTGTIGVQLPMERLRSGIAAAVGCAQAGADAFIAFSDSILTTDTRRKVASRVLRLSTGQTVTIAACAKGAGMMHPNMATLLSFAVTDAAMDAPLLQTIFRDAIARSLNCMTIDGDTSTNDTAIILANGASGATVAADTPDCEAFCAALDSVMQSLAQQLARDGEGATKLIHIHVAGAENFAQARAVGRAIAVSPLVKTAIYGRDANWGRICCAIGNEMPSVVPQDVTVKLGDLELFVAGTPQNFDEERALAILSEEHIHISCDVGRGQGSATVWTCDLTEKYIEINGAYRT